MVWIDEVLSYGPTGGECLVCIRDDAHYMTDGKIRPSSLIEFIAQARGFISVCELLDSQTSEQRGLKEAFLVSITDGAFEDLEKFPEIKIDKKLFVRVGPSRSLGAISLFSGSVWTSQEHCVGSAQIKVFSN
jgi:hypothetical protein